MFGKTEEGGKMEDGRWDIVGEKEQTSVRIIITLFELGFFHHLFEPLFAADFTGGGVRDKGRAWRCDDYLPGGSGACGGC